MVCVVCGVCGVSVCVWVWCVVCVWVWCVWCVWCVVCVVCVCGCGVWCVWCECVCVVCDVCDVSVCDQCEVCREKQTRVHTSDTHVFNWSQFPYSKTSTLTHSVRVAWECHSTKHVLPRIPDAHTRTSLCRAVRVQIRMQETEVIRDDNSVFRLSKIVSVGMKVRRRRAAWTL